MPAIRSAPSARPSAGSQPKGQVHAETLRLLRSLGYDITGFRSKSWVEFLREPQFDFVFTVCDNAAEEACPIWPGRPLTAHWGIPDPAAATGNPAEIAAKCEKLHKLGVEFVLLNGGGVSGHAHESLRRFAREVMPAFADNAKMRSAG